MRGKEIWHLFRINDENIYGSAIGALSRWKDADRFKSRVGELEISHCAMPKGIPLTGRACRAFGLYKMISEGRSQMAA